MDQLRPLAPAQDLGVNHRQKTLRHQMIQELVEVWAWFWGMVAGWGATTIGIVVALVVLFVRQNRLKRRVENLYNRQVAAERDWSLFNNRDKT